MTEDTTPVESPQKPEDVAQTPDLEDTEPAPKVADDLVEVPGFNLNVPVATISDSEVVQGAWAGFTNYKCVYCDYATLEGPEAVRDHIAAQRGFGYAHHFPKS